MGMPGFIQNQRSIGAHQFLFALIGLFRDGAFCLHAQLGQDRKIQHAGGPIGLNRNVDGIQAGAHAGTGKALAQPRWPMKHTQARQSKRAVHQLTG